MTEGGDVDSLFDLTGKVAVVTGGSRGLGLQMVRAFAARGADIVVASRKIAACEEVAQEVRGLGRRAIALSVNASHWADMDRLVAATCDTFGRIDILVNNAGMGPATPSHEMSEELFDKVTAVNFKGPYRLASLAAHRMAQGKGGSIINVSSSASLLPVRNTTVYSGAKAALNAMTVSLAHEYAPKVRVNAILPGPFLTDISKAWTEEMRSRARNALGRPGRAEEIVSTALYLASPASSFTTGALLRCDGGMI